MAAARGAAALTATFDRLRAEQRKALVVYLMAGDPTLDFTRRILPQVQAAGADIVELGYPFSDPVADGPVIQMAGQRAQPNLSGGLPAFLALVRSAREHCDVPLVAMTYYNPIFRYGERKFLADGLGAGLDGVILPDMPIDEADEWQAACHEIGIGGIFMEAPNTPDEQAGRIARAATGFIYLVSLKGVTGSDKGLGENLGARVARFRKLVRTPLVVGFGISTPRQARQMADLCDGAVIGSGVVSRIGDARNEAAAETAVVEYVSALRAALDAR